MDSTDGRHRPPSLPPGAAGLLDALCEAALLVDERGDLLHANPAAVRRWGKLPVGLGGRRLAERLGARGMEASVPGLPGVRLLRFDPPARTAPRSPMVTELAARVELLAEAVGRRQTELERVQARYGQVIDALHDGLVVHAADGSVVAANPRAVEVLGVTEDALRGRAPVDPRWTTIRPDGRPWPRGDHPVDLTLADGEPRDDVRMGVLRPDGEVRWIDITSRRLEDGSAFAAFVDVTARLAGESALHSARERLRRAFEDAPTGLAVVGLDNRVTQVNAAFCHLLRGTEADVLALDFRDVTHPDDLETDLLLLEELRTGARRAYTLEKRYLPLDGSDPIWVQIDVSLVRDAGGEPECYVAHVQDVSERRATESELRHRAEHDPLTGLANRARFQDEVRRELGRVRRGGTSASLVMLDLDRFKLVNDRHGHGVGDEVIRAVASAVRGRLRQSDVVGRLGGDEFAVLLPDTPPEQAERVALELLDRVRCVSVAAGATAVGVTASAGVVGLDPGSAGVGDDLVLADLAMYEAKAAGRDRAARARATTSAAAPAA